MRRDLRYTRGEWGLIVVPIRLLLTACATLTSLTLLVDARHLRGRDDWTADPRRYIALVVVASGLLVVLELGDWLWFPLALIFVVLTALWNLWYVGRRYQYSTSNAG